MASQGGAAICLAEESLKAEKGTASEVGVATAMTMEDKLKILQDKNISLRNKVEEVDSTLMDMLGEINWVDHAIVHVEGALKLYDSMRSRENLEKAKRKETSGDSEGEILKRKTIRGQHTMKTHLPRLRLNQQETTACASKAVNRMSGEKGTKGQQSMKTPLARLRLNQQETTACASKAVNRMSGGPKI